MPKKPRGPGRPFKKGVSGNPEGRPPLPLEVKLLRKVDERRYRKSMTKLLAMDSHQLDVFLNGPKNGVPMLDRICAMSVMEAALTGGHVQRREIWNRLVGPPPRPRDPLADEQRQREAIEGMSDEQLMEAAKAIISEREA
jgi:hypothetical protein